MHLGERALEAHQHTLFRHFKKTSFSAEIYVKTCLKMRILWKKGCEIAATPGAPPPNPHWLVTLLDWGLRSDSWGLHP